MYLAFYKGEGSFFDKLIRKYLKGKYSHVELVLGNLWYTSSPRDGGVRVKGIVMKESNWDLLHIPVSSSQVKDIRGFFHNNMGKKYDWAGIMFSQVLPLEKDNPDRWFCSEICSRALQIAGFGEYLKEKSSYYNPVNLYDEVIKIGGVEQWQVRL